MVASLHLVLTAETDEIRDALVLVKEIHASLAKKHGDDFRKLDRAIERFIEERKDDCVAAHWLGEGKIIAAPSGQLTDILREARRLGVIG